MANLNSLSNFLKKGDLAGGDVITFVDAGEIKDVDFSKDKSGRDIKRVFQITIALPTGTEKIATINKTSQNALAEVWGVDTDAWVGKQATVNYVKQLSFGKMMEVLVLTPVV